MGRKRHRMQEVFLTFEKPLETHWATPTSHKKRKTGERKREALSLVRGTDREIGKGKRPGI